MNGYHKVIVISSVAMQFSVKPINMFEHPAQKRARASEDSEQMDRRFFYTFAWTYSCKQGFEAARLDAHEFYEQARRDYGQISTVQLIPGELSEVAA